MKTSGLVNTERQAAEKVMAFLTALPNMTEQRVVRCDPDTRPGDIDIIAESEFAGRPLRLAIEVKKHGQPRMIRDAAIQLRRYIRDDHADAVPVVVAPYLSRRARDVCREEGVGYLDFMGNALIVSDSIFIEREVPGQPEPERRALRSLYKPKSARILRCLLKEPERSWRTVELADAAQVSTGLVSNVASALRDRSWAEQTDEGLSLTDPNALLDSWAANYEPPRGEEFRRYTTLHGSALLERLRGAPQGDGRIALASFSAAQWLAPHVRHPTAYFYADEAGLAELDDLLDAKPVPRGANVVVVVPDEYGVLDDAVRVVEGLTATSPVQTYLDLLQSGDRGAEGADELRRGLLDWPA